jgi:hypothetical protein
VENPSNGSRDTLEKVLCSPCKVLLVIGCLEPNIHRLHRMRGKCEVQGYPSNGIQDTAEKVFFSPSKVP